MRPTLFASLLMLPALSAHSETFTVTRIDDPLPDGCALGDCSLREAMQAAAINDPFGDIDTIVLSAGTYTLVRGPLNSNSQRLRVQGAGSAQTRIEFADDNEYLFTTHGGELILAGLGINASGEFAGAMSSSNEDSLLSLDDILVEQGTVSLGQETSTEIRNSELRRTLFCYGEALIEDSVLFNLYQMTPQEGTPATVLRRTIVDGTLYPDAPVASRLTVHTGSLTLEHVTVTDSGFRIMGPVPLRIADSTVTRSHINVEFGADAATLHLQRVQYIDNAGPVRTEVPAEVTIEDSLFAGNLTRALYVAGGAEWNIAGSTFAGNRVDGNAGGAIVLEDDSVLRIHNSTFSANSFTVDAAAGGARGAAIGFRNGTGAQLILTHVTIVPPLVMPVGLVGSAIGGHGNGVTLDLSNSLVRGSCGMNANVLQNNAGNIESPGNTCGLAAEGNSVNIATASVALGPLGDNGGPTPTHLPAADSHAIDRASTPQCLPLDQRRYARPGGVRCDVGAVEADAEADDNLFADGFEL